MSRSITDPVDDGPVEQPAAVESVDVAELRVAVERLIVGHNKLYDRIVLLESRLDAAQGPDYVKSSKKWFGGL